MNSFYMSTKNFTCASLHDIATDLHGTHPLILLLRSLPVYPKNNALHQKVTLAQPSSIHPVLCACKFCFLLSISGCCVPTYTVLTRFRASLHPSFLNSCTVTLNQRPSLQNGQFRTKRSRRRQDLYQSSPGLRATGWLCEAQTCWETEQA